MSHIEKVSNHFAEKISKELNLDKDKEEVIAYGTFTIIQMLVSIFLVVLFGWIFHVLFEALIISFIISILRKYSGGVHASLPSICNIIGTAVSVGFAIMLKYTYLAINLWMIIGLGLLIFTGAFLIIYKVAPVDSLAKPIKRAEKIKRMKKGSIFVVCAYLLIVIVLVLFYLLTLKKSLLVYALCVYIGAGWQVFTLTKAGHIVLTKLDTLLNQIIQRRRKMT
jgi:accessory gene regulator B